MAIGLGGSRPFKAVGLLLILTLLLGSGLGFAAAAGDASVSGDHIAVARPGPGDRASYAGKEIILDSSMAERSGGRITEFTVEWLPQTTIRTDDHRDVEAMRLLQTFEWMDQITQYREAFFDVATHEPLADAGYGTYGNSNTICTGVCVNGGGVTMTDTDEYSIRYTSYEEQRGPCGFLNLLHGNIVHRDDGFVERGHCDTLTGFHELTYRPIGRDRIQGHEVRGYQAEEVPGLTIWYAEGVPFPVRFTTTFSDQLYTPYTYGRGWEMTLVDFRDGGAEYDRPEESMAHDAGQVDVVPTTPWMLDDTGVDVPFRLSEAYANLDQDTMSEEPILDWLARHPEAYLAEAWSGHYRDAAGQVQHHWWLTWTDGIDVTGRTVIAHPIGPDLPVAAAPHQVVVYPKDVDDSMERTYPPLALVPAALPAVADVLAEYQHRQDALLQPEAPNNYGMAIYCADRSCKDVATRVVAGHATYTAVVSQAPGFPGSLGSGPVGTQGGADYSHVAVGADGLARQEYAFFRAEEGPTALVSAGDKDLATTQRGDTSRAGIWSLPSSETAAGIGFAALIISALYYFWPVVKTLPVFSLFSRIKHDKVLENPNRAKVMQVIESEPGIHFQQIARRTDMGRGALDHHLRKLTEAGLVVPKVGAGYSCFYPKGVDRREMAMAGVVKSAGARKVYDILSSTGHATVQSLAAETGLSPSTVSHHLGRMKKSGLVEGGGKAGYRPLVLP